MARLARLRAQVASDHQALERRILELVSLDVVATAETGFHAAWAAHHAYSALEGILERVAKALEGGVPTGADSHRELLDAAFLALPDVRPALLSKEIAGVLHDLRGFRHFVRHAYDAELDAGLLRRLQAAAAGAWPILHADITRLEQFLAAVDEKTGV